MTVDVQSDSFFKATVAATWWYQDVPKMYQAGHGEDGFSATSAGAGFRICGGVAASAHSRATPRGAGFAMSLPVDFLNAYGCAR